MQRMKREQREEGNMDSIQIEGFLGVLSMKISCRSCANPLQRLRRQTYTGWKFKQTSLSDFLDKYETLIHFSIKFNMWEYNILKT